MVHSITPTNWQTDQASLINIRELVFIQEQSVPVADEWDDKDETAIHFLVRSLESKAIACARLLVENYAGEIKNCTGKNVFHIGRVAVLEEYRKQDIGRDLIRAIISYCNTRHPDYKIYLHAQTSRQRFYEYLGFAAQGPIFIDAGIPHIEMWFSYQEANEIV
jgi:predicted GNAT family N-acyltransferase